MDNGRKKMEKLGKPKAIQLLSRLIFTSILGAAIFIFLGAAEAAAGVCPPLESKNDYDYSGFIFDEKTYIDCDGIITGNKEECKSVFEQKSGFRKFNCYITADGRVILPGYGEGNSGPPKTADDKRKVYQSVNSCREYLDREIESLRASGGDPAQLATLEKYYKILSDANKVMRQVSYDDPPLDCGYPKADKGYTRYYEKAHQICWICDAFNYILYAINDVSTKTYAAVKDSALGFLSILLALWLTYQVMVNVTIAHQKDQGEFYTRLAMGLVRACIAAIIIGLGTKFWDLLVTPLVNVALDYGSKAMLRGTIASGDVASAGASPYDVIKTALIGATCPGERGMSGGLLKTINDQLVDIFLVGYLMFTGSMSNGVYCFPAGYLDTFIAAVPIMCLGGLLLFIIPLKFVDPLLRMGVVLVLLPLFVIAWVFPSTRNYTAKGFNMLLNAVAFFLIMAIVIAIITSIMETSLGLGEIVSSLGTAKEFPFKKVSDSLNFSGKGYMTLIALLLFSYFVVDAVGEMTNFLTDTSFAGGSTEGLEKGMSKGAGMAGMVGLLMGGYVAKKTVRGALKATGLDGYSTAQRKLNKFNEGTEGSEREGQGRAPDAALQQAGVQGAEGKAPRQQEENKNQFMEQDAEGNAGENGNDGGFESSYDVNKVELTKTPAFKEMSINQKAGYIRNNQGILANIGDFVLGNVRKFAEGEDYHRYL